MYDAIIRSIKAYGTFSEDAIDHFVSYLREVSIKKGASILEHGETCQDIGFLQQGSFLQYYKDQHLNEKVVNLFVANDWVLNHSSFTSQKPSLHRIEAFEDSEILSINIHDLHTLISKYPSFFTLGKILEVAGPNMHFDATPDAKYQELLRQKPEIVKTFPLKYIASYLGMTPETLSRVRGRID